MPRARTNRAPARRTKGKRRKRRAKTYRPPMGPHMGPQMGGNFLFKLLGTVAKTLDALT